MIHREHFIQARGRMFARDAITAPHKFIAFDRAPARSVVTRGFEKARGIISGTSDTMTRVTGIRPLWFEFKEGSNKPSDLQRMFGADMIALGDAWGWGNSVIAYYEFLLGEGVPMVGHAAVLAESHQAAAMAAIEKAEARKGKPSRRPAAPRTRATKAWADRVRGAGLL